MCVGLRPCPRRARRGFGFFCPQFHPRPGQPLLVRTPAGFLAAIAGVAVILPLRFRSEPVVKWGLQPPIATL